MEPWLLAVLVSILIYGATVVLGQQNKCIIPQQASCFGGGDVRGLASSIETRLIPAAEFNCCGMITGWRVVGRTGPGTQFPTLQIWRRNNGTCGEYSRTGQSIIMESSLPSQQVDCDVIEHTLNERDQILVEPGDAIGIELPPLRDQAIHVLFEPGGELNYVYRQQLPDTVNLQSSSLFSVSREQPLIDLIVAPDSTCSSNTLAAVANESNNENRKDAVIKVLGGMLGALLVVITLLIVCLIYLSMRYYRDVHTGAEEGRKTNRKASDASTQTFNSDVTWQISTEENVSYNLMANHINKNAPSKPPPVPVASPSKSVSPIKGSGGKKTKRPPPIPKTAQISDMRNQFETSSDPQPQPAPKATKISDLMKRFEK